MSSSNQDPKSFLTALKATTPARIGIGRAGLRYTTEAQLQFKSDLAASRDTVHRDVPDALIAKLGFLSVGTLAKSRRDYLLNTAAGRSLNEAGIEAIKKSAISSPDIQLITSDGLSSEAFESNVPKMMPLLTSRLQDEKLKLGTPIFIKWARVAVMDHVGEIVQPKASLILVGERPGLGISDSLSGYFEYEPRLARVESDRNVLCNIHKKGVPPEEAALMLAEALIEVLKIKKSGMSVRFDFT